jgi:hypothetical protein
MIEVLEAERLHLFEDERGSAKQCWYFTMIVDGRKRTDLVYAADRLGAYATLNMAYRENRL